MNVGKRCQGKILQKGKCTSSTFPILNDCFGQAANLSSLDKGGKTEIGFLGVASYRPAGKKREVLPCGEDWADRENCTQKFLWVGNRPGKKPRSSKRKSL